MSSIDIHVGAQSATTPFGQVAVNLNSFNYYAANFVLIDVVKMGGSGWNKVWGATSPPDSYVNRLGWISGLPPKSIYPGMKGTCWLLGGPYEFSPIKPGTWVVTWTGPLSVKMFSPGIKNQSETSTRNGLHRRTFELAQFDATHSGQLYYQVTNETNAPGDVSDIKVFHSAHEAALDAGEIFNPDWIASLPRNIAHVRCMDWGATNGNPITDTSQFSVEAQQTWAKSNGFPGGVPPSVLGRLGTRLKCDLWICVGAKFSQEAMNEHARLVASTYTHPGKVIAEFSNETWNSAFSQHNYLRTVKANELKAYDASGALNPAVRGPNAAAHGSLQLWKAYEEHFPQSRVIRQFCGQAANFAGYAAPAFEYVDPGILRPGARFKDILGRYAIAPYFHITGEAGNVLSALELKALDVGILPDSWWREAFARGCAVSSRWVETSAGQARAKKTALPITTYEAGQETYLTMGAANVYNGSIDKANNTLSFPFDISRLFNDGDIAYHYNSVPTGKWLANGLSWNVSTWVRKVGNRQLRFYAWRSEYEADGDNTGKGSIPLDAPPTGYVYSIDNQTRCQSIGNRIKAVLDGQLGKLSYEGYYHTVIRNSVGRLQHFTHYVDTGGYSAGTYSFAWGLKASIYAPDTPRSIWFRALG